MPSDWAADAAGRIETLVTTVRAKTVDRIATVARLLVVGVVGLVMGLAALVLLVIVAVRALDTVLPRTVWVADVVLGTLFVVLGLGLWSKGALPKAVGPPPSPATPDRPPGNSGLSGTTGLPGTTGAA